jgi:tetratricopeptide (TPR) repeat protein
LLLALLAFGVYARTLSYELVWDDPQLLTLVAARVQQGGLAGLLSSRFEFGADQPKTYYRPVVLLSLWLNARAGAATPLACHLTNVLLHVAATVLVFLLLAVAAGSQRAGVIGASLFAVHPALVESVAFVSGRTDLLAAVFVLLAALVWERDRRRLATHRTLERIGGTIAFLLAGFSKEVALVLPGVLLMWDALDAQSPSGAVRTWYAGWWRRNAFWLASWSGCIAVLLAARGLIAGVSFGEQRLQLPFSAAAASLLFDRLATYCRLLVVPWPLNAGYTGRDLHPGVAAAFGFSVLLALFVAAGRSDRGWVGLKSLLWVGGFLAPVLGLVPVSGMVLAERFLYLPLAGAALAVGVVLDRLAARPRWQAPVIGAAAGLVALCVIAATARIPVWQDDLTLYRSLTETAPGEASGFYNLGTAYQSRGRFEAAAAAYRAALRLRQDDPRFFANLGMTLQAMGRHEEALPLFRQALLLDPAFPAALNCLGTSLQQVGRPGEAEAAYLKAITVRPGYAEAHQNLGNVYLAAGRNREAAASYRRALGIDPAATGARYGLGAASARLGLREAALAEYRALLALEPAYAAQLLKAIGAAEGVR